MKTILMVGLVILTLPIVNAASYYISSSEGSSSNTGLSSASPLATLNNLSKVSLSAGDFVYLKRGDIWREYLNITYGSGSAGNYIIIDAYGTGDKPRIMGSYNASDNNFVRFTNSTQTLWTSSQLNSSTNMIYCNTTGNEYWGRNFSAPHLLTQNCDFTYNSTTTQLTIYWNGNITDSNITGNIEIPNQRLVIPGLTALVINQQKNWLKIQNLDIGYADNIGLYSQLGSNVVIQNNSFHNIWSKTVYLNGIGTTNNLTVHNNIFNDTGVRGYFIAAGETIYYDSVNLVNITNNTLEKPHGVVINGVKSQNSRMAFNYVYNASSNPSTQGFTGTYYCDACNNTLIENNSVNYCSMGISINAENSGTKSDNATIRYNQVANCNMSIVINTNQNNADKVANILIDHNTFVKTINGTGGTSYSNMLKFFTNLTFTNNLFYDTSGGSNFVLQLTSYNGTFVSNYNNFNTSSYSFEVNGTTKTLAQWQAYGYDANSIYTNPRLKNINNFNLTPTDGSQLCIADNVGKTIGALSCNPWLYVNSSHASCSNSNTRVQASNYETPWCAIPQSCQQDGDTILVADGFYTEVDRLDIGTDCVYNQTVTYRAQSNNTILSGAVTISSWTNMSNSTHNLWNTSYSTSVGLRCYKGDEPLYPYVTFDKMNLLSIYDMEGSYYEQPYLYIRLDSGIHPSNQSISCFKKNILFNLQNTDNVTIDGFTMQHALALIGVNNDQTDNANNIIIKNNVLKHALTSSGMITIKNTTNIQVLNNTLFTGMGNVFNWAAVKNRNYDNNDTEMTGIQFFNGATNILIANNTIIGAFNGVGLYTIYPTQKATNARITNNTCVNVMDDCWEIETYQQNVSVDNNYAYSVFQGVSLATGFCPTNDCRTIRNFVLSNKTVPYNKTLNYTPYSIKFGSYGGLVTTGWNISHNTFVSKNIGWFDTSESHLVHNTTVKDNIFATGYQYDNTEATYTLYDTGYANNGMIFDYNLHWKYNGSSMTYFKLWNNATGTLSNLTTAKASAYNDDRWDNNSITNNPLLTGWIPQSTSTACNAASDGTTIGAYDCISELSESRNSFLYGSNIVFKNGVILYG